MRTIEMDTTHRAWSPWDPWENGTDEGIAMVIVQGYLPRDVDVVYACDDVDDDDDIVAEVNRLVDFFARRCSHIGYAVEVGPYARRHDVYAFQVTLPGDDRPRYVHAVVGTGAGLLDVAMPALPKGSMVIR